MDELREALQLARDGSWHESHEIVQTRSDPLACLIHAYLHRVEGDDGNARYWYNRAGAEFPSVGLDDELAQLFDKIDAVKSR